MDRYIIWGVALLIAGIILLLIHHILKLKRDKAILQYIGHTLVWKVKKAMIDATAECMDMMPEKIMEAKKTMEGE